MYTYKDYPTAARAVMLYLNEFRDLELDYLTSMVDAAKKANKEIERLRNLLENNPIRYKENIYHERTK